MLSTGLSELKAALSDRYIIEREIARGGMATVYLATDTRHDRQVALKVMHPEIALALGRERFLREIKLTARLSHPNILTVHDSGEAGDYLWYVMPYVEGETLRDQITRHGCLPIDEAVRLAREAAEAIGYAHSLGVVHRDIKPENILLSRGHAVVADFGIARAIETARDDRITGTGITLGTTAYMSPEQALGEEVDAASDVWALGCVLYEMLAGEPPFGTGGREVITRALTREPRSLHEIRTNIPEEIEVAVRKALARDRNARFTNASALATALDRKRTVDPAGVVTKRSPAWLAPYVALGVVLVALVTIFILTRRDSGPSAPTPARMLDSGGSDSANVLIRQARAEDARKTTAGSAGAIRLYMRAIARDSTSATAWGELARATNFAYTRSFPIPGISRDSLLTISLAASERAVALDPGNTASWLVKGQAARLIDPSDMKPALLAVQKALALDSMNAIAWFDLATIKMDLLDVEGLFKARKRSADLNPNDVNTLSFRGLDYLWTRKYQEGLKWTDSAIALDPTFRLAREAKAQLLVELGKPRKAIKQYEVSMRSTAGTEQANVFGLMSRAYAVAGDSVRARQYLKRSLSLLDVKTPRHEAVWVGAALAAVGDTAGAVRLLEAYQPREDLHFQMHMKWDPGLVWLKGKWGRNLLLPDPK